MAHSWSAQGVTVDEIEEELRELLLDAYVEGGHVAATRVLNMITFVDQAASAEVAGRLRHVGRYSASRLLILALRPGLDELRAHVEIASEAPDGPDEPTLVRETLRLELGERHMDDLATIVAPLLVTDLPTLLWSPGGHDEEVSALLEFAQSVLVDSVDARLASDGLAHALALSRDAYVVDLAWLRSTPWRERLAGAFDRRRERLAEISAVEIRHHPQSTASGALALGWLASRLDWHDASLRCEDAEYEGHARRAEREIALRLRQAPEQRVRGLAGVTVETGDGWRLELDRGPGGLRAHRVLGDGGDRRWTMLGASRGEGGVLGEGIRQALLRDPTYAPALAAAHAMLG